jgi:hypothetical protein
VDEIAGFEAFGGEEAPAGAFNLGFSDLDVHFSLLFCLVDSIVDQMKLMSIDDILGVAGSEREDFCCWCERTLLHSTYPPQTSILLATHQRRSSRHPSLPNVIQSIV